MKTKKSFWTITGALYTCAILALAFVFVPAAMAQTPEPGGVETISGDPAANEPAAGEAASNPPADPAPEASNINAISKEEAIAIAKDMFDNDQIELWDLHARFIFLQATSDDIDDSFEDFIDRGYFRERHVIENYRIIGTEWEDGEVIARFVEGDAVNAPLWVVTVSFETPLSESGRVIGIISSVILDALTGEQYTFGPGKGEISDFDAERWDEIFPSYSFEREKGVNIYYDIDVNADEDGEESPI